MFYNCYTFYFEEIDSSSIHLKFIFLYKNMGNQMPYLLTFVTFVCLATSNWPSGHPRSDHHVSNPHHPEYY